MSRTSRYAQHVLAFVILALIAVACRFPGSTKPVIKIGLIAPFEGEQRPFGYQRLYGVKLALQEANLAGGVADYKIELVALNDYGDETETTLQARELVIDSDVRAVIGQWEPGLITISAPIYREAGLAVVDSLPTTRL
jgi:branched-chain amino acid transport system substrate-binding protein